MKKVVWVIPFLFAISGCSPSDSQLEDKGVAEFRLGLKDPDSANFRNLFFVGELGEGLSRSGYVCGEVNAKNAYGAYTGFSRFYIKVSAKTRFLMPILGITYNATEPGIVREEGTTQEKLMDLKEFAKRCS